MYIYTRYVCITENYLWYLVRYVSIQKYLIQLYVLVCWLKAVLQRSEEAGGNPQLGEVHVSSRSIEINMTSMIGIFASVTVAWQQ